MAEASFTRRILLNGPSHFQTCRVKPACIVFGEAFTAADAEAVVLGDSEGRGRWRLRLAHVGVAPYELPQRG